MTSWSGHRYLDDLPPMMFIKKSPNSHGFVNPRDIEQALLLGGGCVCCKLREDLARALKELLDAVEGGQVQADRVVIERENYAHCRKDCAVAIRYSQRLH